MAVAGDGVGSCGKKLAVERNKFGSLTEQNWQLLEQCWQLKNQFWQLKNQFWQLRDTELAVAGKIGSGEKQNLQLNETKLVVAESKVGS